MIFLSKRQVEDGVVARPKTKKFDGDAARQLQKELEKIVASKPRFLVLNLEDVEFITSFGISILLLLNKQLKAQGGVLRLACLSPVIQESLISAKIDSIIQVFKTVEEAI